jgi:ATP-binding cassette subfamily B protein
MLLDDPISQVDFETGARITQAIRRLAGERTVLIVSHRLSAVQWADRILVLDGGRVVQTGSHAELLAATGYYAGAYRLQEVEEGCDAA